MRKLLLLILAFMILSVIPFVSADVKVCNPDSPFTSCYQNTYSYYCAVASPKIQTGNLYQIIGNDNLSYIDPSTSIKVRCDGDSFYLYDASKSSPSCSFDSGCINAVATFNTGQEVSVKLNDYAPIQPMFVCFDATRKTCTEGVARAGTWVSSYWTTKFQKTAVQCTNSNSCGVAQQCVFASQFASSCQNLQCDPAAVIVDHRCVNTALPKICQDAGISNIYICQEYATKYMSILTTQLDQKISAINQLQLDVNQKVSIIANLTSIREEQGKIISKLQLSISDQASIITKLSDKQAEQAKIIDGLQLNIAQQADLIKQLGLKIDEQATLINALQINLAQKAAIVNALTAENKEQASLISAMKLSFTKQGELIDSLNLTIVDDARIISQLTSNVQEQGQIMLSLHLTIDQQATMINALKSTNAEMATLVSSLKLNDQQNKELILQLSDTNKLSQEKIAELEALVAAQKTSYVPYVIGILIAIVVIVGIIVWRRK